MVSPDHTFPDDSLASESEGEGRGVRLGQDGESLDQFLQGMWIFIY